MATPQQKNEPAARAPSPASATHLLVQSKKAGFRRGGRAWPAEWVAVPLTQLTADQLAQIEKEPMLFSKRVSAAEAAELAVVERKPIDPIEQLRADVAALKAENAALKEQMIELIDRSKRHPPLA